MKYQEIFYPEAIFGGFTDIDGTVAFFTRVNSLLNASFQVLDLGCGRGAHINDPILIRQNLTIIKGKVAKVIGADIDINAQENPFIDEFRLIKGNSLPIESNSIDLIVCDNVLEHINNPDKFFIEISRVLKTGGYLCLRTPNRWSYVALFAMIIPNKYHTQLTSIVQEGRNVEDVFPTLYKCNSTWKLKNIMIKNGLECVVYGYESEPSYLSFSKIAYYLGVVHQKFAPRFLKPVMFAFGKMCKK